MHAHTSGCIAAQSRQAQQQHVIIDKAFSAACTYVRDALAISRPLPAPADACAQLDGPDWEPIALRVAGAE